MALIPVTIKLSEENLKLLDAECEAITARQFGSKCSRSQAVNEFFGKTFPSRDRKAYEERLIAEGENVPEVKIRRHTRPKPPQLAKALTRKPRNKVNGASASVN